MVVVDDGYEGLSGPLLAGTSLSMTNGTEEGEFYAVIVYRLDDDTRSPGELASLPFEPISEGRVRSDGRRAGGRRWAAVGGGDSRHDRGLTRLLAPDPTIGG